MREQLLESLICPACEGGSWRVERDDPPGAEIVHKGGLICAACGAGYRITDGILDLLPQPEDVILRERAGWERFLQGAGEEFEEDWLLALPRIDERVSANADSIAHWRRQADNFEYLVGRLNLSGSESVLEIGAGRCWASAYLARKGCQVVALDVVREVKAGGLETAAVYLNHGTPCFDRVLASMERLPFRERTFDVILSVASIHHSGLLDRVVAECGRILRAGGKLALTSEPCIRIFKEKRVQNEETEAGINEHVYNLLDYRRAFEGAGLQATYYLPGALVAMLSEERSSAQTSRLKPRLFGVARLLWRSDALRKAMSLRPANLLGLLFLEYGLTAVAVKEGGIGAR